MPGKPGVFLIIKIFSELHTEIKLLLYVFANIIIDDLPNYLPPIRRINHHIDIILGVSLTNKVAYQMTPRESEEHIN